MESQPEPEPEPEPDPEPDPPITTHPTPTYPAIVQNIQFTDGEWQGAFSYQYQETQGTSYIYALQNAGPYPANAIKYDWELQQWQDYGSSHPQVVSEYNGIVSGHAPQNMAHFFSFIDPYQ